MKVEPALVEDTAKTLYLRALKLLPPDVKAGFDRLAAQRDRPSARATCWRR